MSKTFYFVDEGHTSVSALRCALEDNSTGDYVVACTLLHPLDNHIQVSVPNEGGDELLRTSLLSLKAAVQQARQEVQATICRTSRDL